MREIIFDTETTGFDPFNGDRLVEIGCVEVVNLLPTDNNLHQYINPERDVPAGAVEIHGLTTEFLQDKPTFLESATEFVEYVGDAKLVAHNAEFDMKFINWELENAGLKPFPKSQFVDTLAIARRKFPGAGNSLDALCKRFGVDNTNRVKHGALLDAELLADVYLELMGGRQRGLMLASDDAEGSGENADSLKTLAREFRPARPHNASAEELARHAAFLKGLKDPLWAQNNE